jgi:hypothetical protein
MTQTTVRYVGLLLYNKKTNVNRKKIIFIYWLAMVLGYLLWIALTGLFVSGREKRSGVEFNYSALVLGVVLDSFVLVDVHRGLLCTMPS